MKKMYFLVLSFLLLGVAGANAQVAIGTMDEPKATLDVVASSSLTAADGVIPPRVSLAQLFIKNGAYGTAQTGAIVYVNDVDGQPISGKTAAVTTVGYYYFDGANWQALSGGESGGNRPNLIVTTEQNPSPTAAQLSADVTVILCNFTGTQNGTFTFPALATADKGKLLQISVSTGGGNVGNFQGAINDALSGGNIPNLMGATFMWDGATWFRYSR